MKDKYLDQVNSRRKDVIRYKENIMKVVKIEEVVRQIGQKGPEIMRSLEIEGIKSAVSKVIAESNVKNR